MTGVLGYRNSGRIEYLAAFRTFSSRDLDEARAHVGAVFKPHTLIPHGPASGFETFVNHRSTGSGSLVYFGYGDATVDVDPGPLEAFYLLQFACRGGGRMHYGSRIVDLDPATSAACLSPDGEMHARFEAGTRMLVARIDRVALERAYVEAIGNVPDEPLEFEPQLSLESPGGAELAGLVRRMAAGAGLRDAAGDAHLEELLISTLVNAQPNTWRRHLRVQAAPGLPRHVHVAQEYVHDHASDELTIERLAARAGVGTRTLFAAFSRYAGCSPMEYVANVRLDAVRRALRSGSDATITDVAAGCGFTHMGRFAATYRRRFGEAPSLTRRRSRTTLAIR